jgi:hypothetical protein
MTAERLRGLSDEGLGAAIRATPPAWPASPPLERIVAERIRESEGLPQLRPRLSLPSRRRTVLILVAATLLLAAAAVAARLVVEIGAERVRVLPGPPTSLPGRTLSPEVLGEPASSLGEAASVAGFEPLIPERLGSTSAIWTEAGTADPAGDASARIVLAWRPTPALPRIEGLPWGAVLMEFRGAANLAAKTVFEEALGGFRPVTVEGREGFWVTGEHSITLTDPAGGAPVSLHVTGNVLLWQRGDLTLRLETSLGLPAAVEVAESIP